MSRILPVLFILLLVFSAYGHPQRLTPAEIREVIEKYSPAALPQSPRVAKVKSDADDMHLKGKVREVSDAVLESDGKTLRPVSDHFFDENGALIKHISYDYNGNPWNISVYGYLDGMRVDRGTFIAHDYDPPAPPAMPPRPGAAPPDKRYKYRYEFKYDRSKRLSEEVLYSNNGELIGRTVYSYTGQMIDTIFYSRGDTVNNRIIETYNGKGHLVEQFSPPLGNFGPSITKYKYEKLDSHGNWLRRVRSGKASSSEQDYHVTEVRTVTYY